jgi:SAM-dependent methyltransferase
VSKYRDRIYRHYVDAASSEVAPATIAGLAPRAPYLRQMIASHFPEKLDATILEIGCGHGALLHFAQEAGYTDVAGIDGSPQQVEAAKRLGIANVTQGDMMVALESLPPESHDVVIAFDVLEHLDKDEIIDVTDEVVRILKPGGRWLIHVPNGASPFAGAALYNDFTHETSFTVESMTQLMLASGFRAVEFYEDAPVVHGLKSWVRLVLWKLIRQALRFYLTVEMGRANQSVLTQNFLTVAVK